jgi:hypothetical protein
MVKKKTKLRRGLRVAKRATKRKIRTAESLLREGLGTDTTGSLRVHMFGRGGRSNAL